MDGTSLTPEQEKINALRQVLPEAFSEGKIDWEKLKATLGENINFSNERYVLNWAGKSDAFKVLQTPTTKTLIPAKDESVDFDKTKNIFIEGENLEVLKVLQKSYFGKVKMIYIDPPYNTGNDSFIYPDKFSETKADYEKRVGDKDEDGYMTKDGMFKKNSKENGQYHSNWLNMMMPRLYLAKNLLKQDGVIFVSIDDNEVHNLRLLMNEIFGEENFVASFMWKRKKEISSDSKNISIQGEYILAFTKSDVAKFKLEPLSKEYIEKSYNEANDDFPDGKWRPVPITVSKGLSGGGYNYKIINPNGFEHDRLWAYPEEGYKKLVKEQRVYFGKDGNGIPQRVIYAKDSEGQPSTNYWDNVTTNKEGKKEVLSLFEANYFDTPKPTKLILKIINLVCDRNDLIVDFFAGSGTTAHAVMDLNKEDGGNRKSISVQLPELTDEKSETYKAGYKTIADISKERIRRAGKKIQVEVKAEIEKLDTRIKKLQGELPTDENKTEIENLKTKIEQLKNQDLGFKVLKLEDSNFKQWQQIEGTNVQPLAEQMKLFIDPVSESATIENMVYELLLKSGKNLNSKIEKAAGFYTINNNELVFLLEKASQEIIDSVLVEKPIKVIALDKLFKGNDQLKTNTVLQMKDAGIEFKTI